MSAAVIRPAFADSIPPRQFSNDALRLREVAHKAIDAAASFRALKQTDDDDEYHRRDRAVLESRAAFQAALVPLGLDAKLISHLIDEGVIS